MALGRSACIALVSWHDADEEPDEWTSEAVMNWAFASPSNMPRTIRHVVRVFCCRNNIAQQVVGAHRAIKLMCLRHGVIFNEVPPEQLRQGLSFDCHLCYKPFSTVQGLNAHFMAQAPADFR